MEAWKETQKFADRTVLLIVVAIPILLSFFVAFYYQSMGSLIIVLSCLALMILLMVILKLEVRIDEKGIHFKFFPFHTTERLIPWEEVKEWKLRDVNALMDFAGIGIRYTGNKKGFIINSRSGLEITKTDKRIIVISITDKAGAEEAIRNFRSSGS
jgi:hypothetical protein